MQVVTLQSFLVYPNPNPNPSPNPNQVVTLQSFLFAALCGAHMLVLRIIQELWLSAGGVFNVDEVLQQMAFGLEEELAARMNQFEQGMGSWSVGGAGPED